MDRRVAIKILPERLSKEPEAQARFEREDGNAQRTYLGYPLLDPLRKDLMFEEMLRRMNLTRLITL